MPYDAITLDTSAFHRAGLKLESGLLAKLAQFSDLPSDFVLSEIVTRELVRHLTQNGKKARDTAISALTEVTSQQLIGEATVGELKAALGDSRDIAPQRVASFTAATSAEILPASLCTMDDLLKLYFSSQPPFASTGDKKSEFPDAIALVSLEKWAKSKGKTILAVSHDKDWTAFAATSAHIDVETDLAAALQLFQAEADKARAQISELITVAEAGGLPDLAGRIEDSLRDALGDHHFYAEANSDLYFDSEAAGIALKDFSYERFGPNAELDIQVVQIAEELIAARVSVSVRATASASFSLSKFDGIDRDYVSMGTQNADADIEFDGAILLTIEGDFDGDPADLELTDFELLGAPGEIDFGTVEYDPGDWGDYDDFEALLDVPPKAEGEAAPTTDF